MKVLITREIPQAGINILHAYSDRIQLDYRQGKPLTEEALKLAVKGVDAIIPVAPDQITKNIIKAAGKNLKVISTYSVGYDHIDVDFATQSKIYVGHTPGYITEAVAEHALALMMAVGRRVVEADTYCRDKKYKYWDPMLFIGTKFMGKTLGIIGLGRIGQHLARMCKYGFNMKILYTDPQKQPEAENLLDAQRVELDYLLEHSDIVSLCTNLTESNHHLIGENELRKMKPLSYLINTSRGKLVNEDALALALKENWIAGAALDVFDEEPKINSSLLKLNNVVLSPHIASATWEARIQMARMSAENIIDVLINNKPPRYIVNSELAQNTITSLF